MMKTMIKTLLLVILAVSLVSVSLAEEVTVSEREKAIRLADQALEEKYGITLAGQDYFERFTEEWDDGCYMVQYRGMYDWQYVLGSYLAVVKDGAVTEIRWTHDGEDTSGGLDAMAWGSEQVLEMLRLNQEAADTSEIDRAAAKINRKVGFNYAWDYPTDEEKEAVAAKREEEAVEIREMAKLSVEEMDRIARQAIISLYNLPEGQASRLVNEHEWEKQEYGNEEENGNEGDSELYNYVLQHGLACYTSCFSLGDGEEEGELRPDGLRYTENEGTYWVYVNVETGTVEEIFYSVGIGGNG